MSSNNFKIDNLQYCNWSKEIFQINREAQLDAIHVTIAYHEDFDEVKNTVKVWNKHFQDCKDLKILKKLTKKIKQQFFLGSKIVLQSKMILVWSKKFIKWG